MLWIHDAWCVVNLISIKTFETQQATAAVFPMAAEAPEQVTHNIIFCQHYASINQLSSVKIILQQINHLQSILCFKKSIIFYQYHAPTNQSSSINIMLQQINYLLSILCLNKSIVFYQYYASTNQSSFINIMLWQINYLLSISCFNKSIDIEIVQKLVLGYAAPSSGYGAYSARSGEGVSDEKSL